MNRNILAKDSNGVICLCPLDGIIDVISKKWALLIINEIGNHKRIRYNNLMMLTVHVRWLREKKISNNMI